MPLFAILFFILCLANCGAPLTLNFIGEFLSLYGVFERSSLYGVFASSSIIFSAAYTIYMFQRIAFGGSYSRMFTVVMPDLTKREFTILMLLTVPTVILGIYPALITDGLAYGTSLLIYSSDSITGDLIVGAFSPGPIMQMSNDRNLRVDSNPAQVPTTPEPTQQELDRLMSIQERAYHGSVNHEDFTWQQANVNRILSNPNYLTQWRGFITNLYNGANNFVALVSLGFIWELPFIRVIIAILLSMVDGLIAFDFIVLLQPLFEVYRFYRLSSKIRKTYHLLAKVYSYLKKIIAYLTIFSVAMLSLIKREFVILTILAVLIVLLGICPALITDGIAYCNSILFSSDIISGDFFEAFSASVAMKRAPYNRPSDNETPVEEIPMNGNQNGNPDWNVQENVQDLANFTNCPGRTHDYSNDDSNTEQDNNTTTEQDNNTTTEQAHNTTTEQAHNFMESTPENYNPTPDEQGASDATTALCQRCSEYMDNATEAYVTCISCGSSWCTECTTILSNMIG